MVVKVSANEVFNMYFVIIENLRCKVKDNNPLVNILKLIMVAILWGVDELDKVVGYLENK